VEARFLQEEGEWGIGRRGGGGKRRERAAAAAAAAVGSRI